MSVSSGQDFQNAISELVRRTVDEAVRAQLEAHSNSSRHEVQNQTQATPMFVDIAQLAEMLRLGTPDAQGRRPGGIRTIREWVKTGRIPYRRAGGRVLFLVSEILEWTAAERDRSS